MFAGLRFCLSNGQTGTSLMTRALLLAIFVLLCLLVCTCTGKTIREHREVACSCLPNDVAVCWPSRPEERLFFVGYLLVTHSTNSFWSLVLSPLFFLLPLSIWFQMHMCLYGLHLASPGSVTAQCNGASAAAAATLSTFPPSSQSCISSAVSFIAILQQHHSLHYQMQSFPLHLIPAAF